MKLFIKFYNPLARWILYAAVFVVGFVAISLWSFWLVTHPTRIISSLHPKQFSLPVEKIVLVTEDGIKIAGWFLSESSAEKRPAIVVLHGYPADKGDTLFLAKQLYEEFDILLIDFRYFGESKGSYTTLGAKEQFDLKAAVDFIESRGYEKIGVLGFSLGGAVGILHAAEDSRIGAVASYASFADLKILGEEAYNSLFILKKPLVELISLWSHMFYGINIKAVSPKSAAVKLKIPVFIIHTKQDEQISIKHAYLLRDALKDNDKAEFYLPERGLHGQLPPDFEKRVIKFFTEALK